MIMLLGGTSESRDLAFACAARGFNALYTSTTTLIGGLPESIERWTGSLTPQLFESLSQEKIYHVL